MHLSRFYCVAFSVLLIASVHSANADDKSAAKSKPSEAELMAQMMELAKPGDNHRLLEQLVGKWAYSVKMSTAPGAAMVDMGKGECVGKSLMGGRYVVSESNGTMLAPGPDGKVTQTEFNGMSTDGYDNVKKKFVSTWLDNMGTSIVVSEGTYDPASKTLNYSFEFEVAPGVKTKAREALTIVDSDHRHMAWSEEHRGKYVETMAIDYTREK